MAWSVCGPKIWYIPSFILCVGLGAYFSNLLLLQSASKLGASKQQNHLGLTLSVGQACGEGLAGQFSLLLCHAVVVVCQRGCGHPEGWTGVGGPLPRWLLAQRASWYWPLTEASDPLYTPAWASSQHGSRLLQERVIL